MAQAGYTPIQLYYSTTASAAPSSGNLANGELAINITDGKLYYKDNGGTVRVLAGTGGTGVVAGSNTQVQFNNNGVFGASSGLTWDGTNLTASQLRSSGLTSGRVTYASTSGLLVDSANLLYSGTDLTVYGITVGRGAGGDATNTALGGSALANNTTGDRGVAVGASALSANTSGDYNTAVGYAALSLNTTGASNTAVGTNSLSNQTTGLGNTAVGLQSGLYITTGSANNAFGTNAIAGQSGLTTGTNNCAFGSSTLGVLTTGGANSAYGNSALGALTTGNQNTAVGFEAMRLTTTAGDNTAVGHQALYSNTTGAANVAVGRASLITATTATGNTAVGERALTATTTGAYNTGVGQVTLLANTTGQYNSAFGTGAMLSNTTGANNTALGMWSLYSNTTASNNTAVGYQAGYSATTSLDNTLIGYQAGYSLTTGNGRHTAVGYYALRSATSGTDNVAIGYYAGRNTTTGIANVFIGGGQYGIYLAAGDANTTGSLNTYVGAGAGRENTTGSKNTILGNYSGNQGGLDIRASNNYIVLSDGDGNPRLIGNGSGNFGVNTPPWAWGSGYKVIDFPNTGAAFGGPSFGEDNGSPIVACNTYNDGGAWRYKTTGQAASLYNSRQGNWTWAAAASGTAGNAITFTQVMHTGLNTTLALQGASPQSGTGITFPATQNASSNANTLDDYEEGSGSWSSIQKDGAGSSVGANTNELYYIKIGQLVYVKFRVQIASPTSATSWRLSGLPFTNNNADSAIGVTLNSWNGMAGKVYGQSNYIDVYVCDMNGTPVNWPYLYGTIVYFTN